MTAPEHRQTGDRNRWNENWINTVSEAVWQSQVVQIARLHGWTSYHTHDSRRSVAGYPDLTLVRGSRLIFAELKRQTGRTTREQQEWLDLLAGAGAETYLWRPSHLADVVECLSRPR